MTDMKTSQERVEEFFDAHKGVHYSPRTIAKRLGIKRRAVSAICSKTKRIERLDDNNVVGLGSQRINLFFV